MIPWEAGRMRFDYALYVVAMVCFIIAIYAYVASLAEVTELYLYVLAVIGVVFIGLGYMARPKTGNTCVSNNSSSAITTRIIARANSEAKN